MFDGEFSIPDCNIIFCEKMKLFYALLFTVADALSHETSSLLVSTTSGHVHGHVNKTAPDVRQFRGIPFAHPPVGELRWMPPVPLPKSAANNQINATSYGPNCPQYLGSSPTVWMVDTPQFNTENNLGEDCLSISVYAPLRPRRGKLPVIIWMYGGGLIGGGQDTLYYEPSQWIQRTQEHIVVAMK